MQQRFMRLLLALCTLTALALTSCHKDSDNNNPANPGNPTTNITTTIVGLVNDESGNPVSGVQVKAYGQTVQTNTHGLFILHNIHVPSDRCFVIATHSGYFNAARAEVPRNNGVTNMRLSLMSNTPTSSVNATTGGKITVSDGGSIDLPANGYVNAQSGSAYTGTVHVAARRLNPESATFFNYFAGDFTAQRTDGSQTDLLSYGVLRVELTGGSGEKLQLASGKSATMSYPVPGSMQTNAPSEMPLWYFDEQLGMWKEEGKAVKQGNVYTGTVNHFSEWNCDYPGKTADLEGTVRCSNEPVPGVIVTIGERQVITDENGHYQRRVPAGITFDISVNAALNMGTSAAPVSVGPYSIGAKSTQDIVVSPCPAYVTGTLVGCNNEPVEGVIELIGGSLVGDGVVGPDGKFKVRVVPGMALTIDGFGYDGAMSMGLPVDPVQPGETKEIGNIQICSSGNPITYTDITVDGGQEHYVYSMAFSPDGSRLAAVTYTNIFIYNTQDGTLLQTINSGGNSAEFSDDGSKLITLGVWNAGNPVNVWDVATGQNIHTFTGVIDPHFLPGGNSLVAVKTSSPYNVVKLDVSSGNELASYAHGKGTIQLIGTRANGTQFVATSSGLTFGAFVWDMTNNVLSNEFTLSPSGDTTNTRLSYDKSLIVMPSQQGLNLYNVVTGQLVNTVTMSRPVYNFALAPNNNSFVTQVYGQTKPETLLPPAIYSIPSASILNLLPTIGSKTYFSNFIFSNQGTHVAAYTNDEGTNKIRIWQLP